jgi:hypothetical protein
LTFDNLINDLNWEHLGNIGKATLISIWTKHIQSPHDFTIEAMKLFTNKYKKHSLKFWKSEYYSLKTSNIDESLPAGAKDMLADIVSQLKLQEADFDNILIPVVGDGPLQKQTGTSFYCKAPGVVHSWDFGLRNLLTSRSLIPKIEIAFCFRAETILDWRARAPF